MDRKRVQFRNLFNTPDGRVVLKCLEDEFNSLNIMAATSELTAYNLGKRDVVMYINQMIGEDNDRTND